MNKIKILKDEFVYIDTLKSGLIVAIHPTPNFKRTIVSLQVKFGGIDIFYEINNQKHQIPAGVAHFLEHMLFSNNGRNLAGEFSNYGANVNAYTSKSITSYKFSCIDHFDYLLDYFLTSFIKPDFSYESIEKEKKIIAHELNMSMDSLHHKIYQKLKKLMYADKAVTSDVGGTVNDILKINQALLDEVFNTYYHPKNMSLIISGNVKPEEVFNHLNQHPYNLYEWPKFKSIKRITDFKKRKTHHHTQKVKNNNTNMISIGVTVPESAFDKYPREFIHISLGSILSNAFGLASKNFDTLKKENLMNVSFSCNTNLERDYGYINIYMQTEKQEKYFNTIMKMIKDINKRSLDEELFDIDKKMILGNYISVFDSLSRIHDFIASCIIEDINLETYLENVMNLKFEDLNELRNIFTKDNIYSVRYLK